MSHGPRIPTSTPLSIPDFWKAFLGLLPWDYLQFYTHPPHAKLHSSYSGDLSSLKETVFFCEALKQGMVYDSMKRVSFVY